MALDFPSSPTNGQIYDNYYYDSATGAWRAQTSASALTTRVTALEVADAGLNKSGLVPAIPTSLTVASGTASADTAGTVTFTAASSISLNGVFTSAYRNYRLVIDIPTASAAGSVFVRFRNGTTDDATNTYYQYWTMKRLNGTTQDNTGGPSTGYALFNFITNTNTYYAWTGDIMTPALSATQTTISGKGFGQDATTTYVVDSTILFNTARGFDGITFYTGGPLITGTAKILGYR